MATMNKYQLDKRKAQNKAAEWQHKAADTCQSYGELLEASNYFYKLGKKYGLIKEFKENGII